MSRLSDILRFYDLLGRLEHKIGGVRVLDACSGRDGWPRRGVYFFFEPGEFRSGSGQGLRVVRVGTHALKANSRSTLWGRLRQHKGSRAGGGNHRGSIFRLIVGTALVSGRQALAVSSWGQGNTADRVIRDGEQALELAVSKVIGAMPFLWVSVDGEPGPESLRGVIERNVIALLSHYQREPVDPPSVGWLGRRCNRTRVLASGLWNWNHVDEDYDPGFLDVFDELVERCDGR